MEKFVDHDIVHSLWKHWGKVFYPIWEAASLDEWLYNGGPYQLIVCHFFIGVCSYMGFLIVARLQGNLYLKSDSTCILYGDLSKDFRVVTGSQTVGMKEALYAF